MSLRLQSFNFRKSPYERPNEKWVCGRPEAPCKIGPDGRGHCRVQAECAPRKDGSRWACTRSRDQGGPCAEGPRPDGRCAHPIPPCQPVRSIRAKRGLVTRWATVLTLGLMVIALAGGDRDTAISPGALTAEHAEVADCAGCHSAGGGDASDGDGGTDGGPSGLVRAALSGIPPAHQGDSLACLDCHQMGEHPFQPHSTENLPTPDTDPDSETPQLSRPYGLHLASQSFAEPDETGDGTACASCHSEHRGPMANLTAMSDARCQACHTQKFAALSAGHPDFGAYPYTRRTRIDFDHVAHVQKYFQDADAAGPERCTDCHATDDAGRMMLTKSFQETCAACHAGEIRGQKIAGSPGLPVLAVPGVDVVTLREQGVGIGAWPELADADLTPFMRAVLAGREGIDPATLTRFGELDTMDLRGASEAELATVKRVAWAVKRLVYDLTAEGPGALAEALRASLEEELSDAAVRDMLGELPHDTVRAAQQEWFPDLAKELARRDAGQEVPIPGGPPADAEDSAEAGEAAETTEAEAGSDGGSILGDDGGEDGGGLLDGQDGEQEAAGDSGGLTGGDDDGAESDGEGDSILGGDGSQSQDGSESGDLLGGSDAESAETEGGGSILGDDATGSEEGGDLLGGGGESAQSTGEDGGILGGDANESEDGGGLLGGEDGGSGDLMDGGGGEAAAEADGADESTEKPWKDAAMPEPVPADWSRMGGWYRDFFVLYYRPHDHADWFLRRWLTATAPQGGGDGPAAAIFDRLADPKAPGKCVKCHSVDRRPEGGFAVNWQGRHRAASGSRLTRFVHAPHLTLTSGRKGCITCHALDRDADYAASFDDRDPATFTSNFQPVDKATCTQCHVDRLAGDSCTQCHTYHAEQPASRAVKTVMGETAMGE